ncbi:MAG TPA: Ig-like domain-containing protein [Methanocorpusculum sp.]|nr:Ig-like domain-containing protein [Methanocorpusculum sp.]
MFNESGLNDSSYIDVQSVDFVETTDIDNSETNTNIFDTNTSSVNETYSVGIDENKSEPLFEDDNTISDEKNLSDLTYAKDRIVEEISSSDENGDIAPLPVTNISSNTNETEQVNSDDIESVTPLESSQSNEIDNDIYNEVDSNDTNEEQFVESAENTTVPAANNLSLAEKYGLNSTEEVLHAIFGENIPTQCLDMTDEEIEKLIIHITEMNKNFTGIPLETREVESVHKEEEEQPPVFKFFTSLFQSNSVPSAYNLRDINGVTPVQAQMYTGLCWTFAVVAAAETNAIKNGYATKDTINLAEFQPAYFHTHRKGVTTSDDNGNVLDEFTTLTGDSVWMSDWVNNGEYPDYLLRTLAAGIGFADDSGFSPFISPSFWWDMIDPLDAELATSKNVYTLKGYTQVNINDREDVKKLIQEKGGGVTTMNINKADLKLREYGGKTSLTHYNPSEDGERHAVCIVGWDENFPKEYFLNQPESNGAWLIKNSWWSSPIDFPGDGDDGYFLTQGDGYIWVSYNEPTIYDAVFIDVIPEALKGYDFIYQYDGGVVNKEDGQQYKSENSITARNIFTATGNHVLNAVSFETENPNLDYTIEIVKNGKTVSTTAGSLVYEGYYMIPLTDSVCVVDKEEFEVRVTLKNNGYGAVSFPADTTKSVFSDTGLQKHYTSMTTGTQSSYWDTHNGKWIDITRYGDNFRIKAFAKDDLDFDPVTSITLDSADWAFWNGITLIVNNNLRLTATCCPTTAMQDVTWTSTNPAIAPVDVNGMVVPRGTGSAMITATAKDGTGVSVTQKIQLLNILGLPVIIKGEQKTMRPGETDYLTHPVNMNPADVNSMKTAAPMFAASAPPADGTDIIEAETIETNTIGKEINNAETAGEGINKDTLALESDTLDEEPLVPVFAAAETHAVTWTSSNGNVVTVSSSGKVTARTPGYATVTGIADGDQNTAYSVDYHVVGDTASSITLDGKPSVSVNEEVTITAHVSADILSINWNTEKASGSTAAITNQRSGTDAAGNPIYTFTALNPGKITIIATSSGTGAAAKFDLTITSASTPTSTATPKPTPTPDSRILSITPVKDNTLSVTDVHTFTVSPSGIPVEWFIVSQTTGSGNINKDTGLFTPLSTGTVTIKAKATDGSAKTSAEYTFEITAAALQIIGDSVIDMDKTICNYKYYVNVPGVTVKWDVYPRLATVNNKSTDEFGYSYMELTPSTTGYTTITAKISGNGYYETLTKNIELRRHITSITIKGSDFVEQGKTTEYCAEIAPSSATATTITWDSETKSVATISDTGVLTAIKAGKTKITAAANDGSGVIAEKTIEVTPVRVTAIELDKTTARLQNGKTLELKATVRPSNAGNLKVTWTSSDDKVASVNRDTGKVTANKAGSVKITAVSDDNTSLTASCDITVFQPVTKITLVNDGIELNSNCIYCYTGDELDITVKVSPPNAENKEVKLVKSSGISAHIGWEKTSSDANGNAIYTLCPYSSGTYMLHAEAADGCGAQSPEFQIYVIDPIQKVVIKNNDEEDSISTGEKKTLEASITPDITHGSQSLIWKAYPEGIVSLPENGDLGNSHKCTVTALKGGDVAITAIAADGHGAADIHMMTVVQKVTGITLTAADAPIINDVPTINIGETTTVKATITPFDAADKTLSWKSDRDKIATVDDNGVITANSAGSVKITATAQDGSNVSGSITIAVSPQKVESITLDQTTAQLAIGKTLTLSATVGPTTATNKTIKWSSSDYTVATVNEDTGVVKGISAGPATITATAQDGSGVSASCEVKVTVPVAGITLIYDGKEIKEWDLLDCYLGDSLEITAKVSVEDNENKDLILVKDFGKDVVIKWDKTSVDGDGNDIYTLCPTASGLFDFYAQAADGSEVKSALFELKVIAPIEKVVISGKYSLPVGMSTTLTAEIDPNLYDNRNLEWSAEPEGIVSLTPGSDTLSCTVKGLKGGPVTITASAKDGHGASETHAMTVIQKGSRTLYLNTGDKDIEGENLDDPSVKGHSFYFNVKAEIGYEYPSASSAVADSLTAPVFSRMLTNGKYAEIQLNEKVLVYKENADGTWTEVKDAASFDAENKVVLDVSKLTDAAKGVRINFVGRYLGDIDGNSRIQTRDSGMINSHICETTSLDATAQYYADVDGNGRIQSRDSGLINSYLGGESPILSATRTVYLNTGDKAVEDENLDNPTVK